MLDATDVSVRDATLQIAGVVGRQSTAQGPLICLGQHSAAGLDRVTSVERVGDG